jgi:threonyl-tRNA synthetase
MSDMITISFPDGAQRQYEPGVTAMEIAKSIAEGLAKKVLVASVNGVTQDAAMPINNDATVKFFTWDDNEGKATFWHSSAHLLAEAIEAIFPGTKFGIGPAIETGFYYDIDLGEQTITDDDLLRIQKKMQELANQNNIFERSSVSKVDAVNYFTDKKDPYKLELIEGLNDGEISFYKQGGFTDLCRGPHIPHTGLIKAIKLNNIAGAYWRGNEKNKMLTRIYAVSYPNQKLLDEYVVMMEEAKKRDHRVLGKELELFMFSEKVGSGLPMWLPKGAMLRERLQNFLQQKQMEIGYLPVITPHIGNKSLYVCSGHYEKYGADSFQPIRTPQEGEEFYLKPMNCPHHCEMYKNSPKSYKDLPVRFAEFGTVYRYEQSGELHGLTRVRGFTQDDAHLFCRPDQVQTEFANVIDLVLYVFKALGFTEYTAQISLRHQTDRSKYIGSEENWAIAEQAIIDVAAASGLKTVIEYDEAAFYGPKLDFMVRDAIGRKWQLGTIQVDYNLPERFELEYVDADNTKKRPVMIHRAPFGSMERFIAVLTEHCAGKFPLWLTPTQVKILPISDKFLPYCDTVLAELKKFGIRAEIDDRNEKIGKKIRDTELKKIPFMLVIGEKEVENNQVAVRKQGQGDAGVMDTKAFAAMILELINEKL